MNERLKILRKELCLNQEDFGNRIGVTKASISRLESGVNNFTEQTIKSICREFNVDYLWLTTGIGEMFLDSDTDIIARVDYIMTGENNFHKQLIKTITSFDNEDLIALERLIDKFMEHEKVD